MLRFLKPTLNEKTTAFVVHGEVDQAEAFAAKLMAGGMRLAMVPAMDTSVVTTASIGQGIRPDSSNSHSALP